jgi:hypothetical protein
MKKIIIFFLVLAFSCCKKDDPPAIVPPDVSASYKEAHYFDFNGHVIRLKDKYLPHYTTGVPYEKWNFEKINERGYLYTSLKDTPWVVPTFFSYLVDMNSTQRYNTQRAYDEDTAFFVYNVRVKMITNNITWENDHYAVYLVHKTNPNDKKFILCDISSNPRDYKLWVYAMFFGDFSFDDRVINFEYINSNKMFGSAIGKWQVESWGPSSINKRIKNVEFHLVE